MGHKDNRLGTLVEQVFDRWKSGDDSLWVGDDTVLHWYVEVNSHEDSAVLDEVWDMINCKFLG